MWYRVKYRDETNKLHLDIVEADNAEEAFVCGEIVCGTTPEAIELIDETAFVSPLLSKVVPL